MIRQGIWSVITAGALAAAFVHPAAAAAVKDDQDRSVMELLRNVEVEMDAISDHAAKLEEMTAFPERYDRSSVEFEWNSIRIRFNEAGKLIPMLQKAPDAQSWQKEIVDQVAALMKAMDSQIESGIQLLNQTTAIERLRASKLYPVRTASVHHYAQLIGDLVDLAQDRQKMAS
jgi:hypothetical protein